MKKSTTASPSAVSLEPPVQPSQTEAGLAPVFPPLPEYARTAQGDTASIPLDKTKKTTTKDRAGLRKISAQGEIVKWRPKK